MAIEIFKNKGFNLNEADKIIYDVNVIRNAEGDLEQTYQMAFSYFGGGEGETINLILAANERVVFQYVFDSCLADLGYEGHDYEIIDCSEDQRQAFIDAVKQGLKD